MRATELMIGDLIQYNGEILRLYEFSRKYGYFGDGHPLNGILISEIEPIPLTAEILEKNGFKNTSVITIDTRKMRWVSDDTRTEITIWMDDTLPMEIVKNVYYEDEVAYTLPSPGTVSQLQHALRLCGINLEIKL